MAAEVVPEIPQDWEIEDQQSRLQAEVERLPFVGEVADINVLLDDDYRGATPVIRTKIDDLTKKVQTIQRIRPDGSCFYRAVGYRLFMLMHMLPESSTQRTQKYERLEKSKDWLIGLGFPEFGVEEFYEVFMEELNAVMTTPGMTGSAVRERFNERYTSDYIVTFLRLLTAGYIKENSDFFLPFLSDGMTIEQFCRANVEAVNSYADQPQIIALSSVLMESIEVFYLDQSPSADGSINCHVLGPESLERKHLVTLLFRPGHYDILNGF